MIRKGNGGEQSWKWYRGICWERLRKKTLNSDTGYPSRDSNRRLSNTNQRQCCFRRLDGSLCQLTVLDVVITRFDYKQITFLFQLCCCHMNTPGWSNDEGWDWRGMWHAWGREELRTGFWWENRTERAHLEDPGLVGKVLLECLVNNLRERALDSSGSGQEQVASWCEDVNELSSSTTCVEFLDWLKNGCLQESAAWY